MDYNIFYKDGPLSEEEIEDFSSWDIFISAYNLSDRVRKVFAKIDATSKYWFVHPEYCFEDSELPNNSFNVYTPHESSSESEAIFGLFEKIVTEHDEAFESLKGKKICIDSTGFLRPHLIYLILFLYKTLKLNSFAVIYSEPDAYQKGEKTEFSAGAIQDVRFVEGFSGRIDKDAEDDLLIIGAGFDHSLISEVVDDKISVKRKEQIVGFPPLQAEMYQQSRLQIKAVESLNAKPYFSPANDPFVTANVLDQIVKKNEKETAVTNLYLSPMGTKAQTLGFALFGIHEFFVKNRAGGIIFPVSEKYSKKTGAGLSRAWIYHLEFPLE